MVKELISGVTMIKLKKYNWKDYDKDIAKLVRRIKYAKFKPNTIVALARGGLIPGVSLSHRLKVPLLIISTSSYQGQQRGSLAFNASFTRPIQSPVLIIDDIVDSGETMSNIHNYIASLGVDVRTASLFYKERSLFKPTWYLRKVKNEAWINFAWE